MSRNAAVLWGVVILAVVVALGQGSHEDWQLRRNGEKMQFTIKRFETGHGKWVSTFTVPRSAFRGLPDEIIDRGGKAQFEYVRDAGKLICTGRFVWGSGAGTFHFVPNPQFGEELKKLGYDAPSESDLFGLMAEGFSLEFARSIKQASISASFKDLLALRDQGVSMDFIRDVRLEGYRALSARDFIELHNQGVDTSFLRRLRDAGYSLPPNDVVRLRNQGVDGSFLKELQTYGLHPTVEEMLRFRSQGINPHFVDAVKGAGYSNLTAEEMVQLHASGVSAAFLQACTDLGYHFTSGELLNLQHNGVDAGYLRRLKESGMRTLTAAEITKLRNSGVD